MLREKCVHNPNTGSHWTTSILFSLVQELAPLYDVTRNKFDGGNKRIRSILVLTYSQPEQRSTKIIQMYNNFASKIEELGLETAADAKPIIDVRSFR